MVQDDDARQALLDATVELLAEYPPERLTVNAIADRADCAKGLVHYHFKKKDGLLAAAAREMWLQRRARWTDVLGRHDAQEAINGAWQLLREETDSGAGRSAAELAGRDDELIGQSAKDGAREFREAVAVAVEGLLHRLDRRPTIPPAEIGQLVVAMIAGLELELDAGAGSNDAEAGWAAFWLGLLSLTEPT